MGLFNKLKNALFEEEYVEVEEKPKKEPKPIIEKEKIERRRRRDQSATIDNIKPADLTDTIEKTEELPAQPEPIKEDTIISKENSFKQFDDDDFAIETKLKRVEKVIVEEPVVEEQVDTNIPEKPLYQSTAYKKENYKEEIAYKKTEPYSNPEYKPIYAVGEKKDIQFKPTPIISPIFGILDKNYKKEDVMDKKEVKKSSNYVSNKVDIDSVRQKAFGELNDDLNLTGEDSFKHIEEEQEKANIEEELEDNLLYDLSDTTTAPVVNKVTVADAEEYFDDLGLEYNVDYKDSKYEKASGRHVKVTQEAVRPEPIVVDEEDSLIEKEPVVIKPKKKEDDKLEDNLFDLIDSMYEDKE